jgi:hypothetical protein
LTLLPEFSGTPGLPILLLATLGCGLAAARWGRPGVRGRWHILRAPRLGAMPLLTVTAAIYLTLAGSSSLEYQGAPDLLPFGYLLGFWAGWAVWRLSVWADTGERTRDWRRVLAGGAAVALLTSIVAAFAATLGYQPSLTVAQQRREVRALLGGSGAGSFHAVDLDEVYVLTETASRWRYLRLGLYHEHMLEQSEPQGCTALVADLDAAAFGLVLLGRDNRGLNCLPRLASHLLEGGYSHRVFPLTVSEPRPGGWGLLPENLARDLGFPRFQTPTRRVLVLHRPQGKSAPPCPPSQSLRDPHATKARAGGREGPSPQAQGRGRDSPTLSTRAGFLRRAPL